MQTYLGIDSKSMVAWGLWEQERVEWRITKERKGSWGGNRYAHYGGCGHDFIVFT